MYFKRHSVIRPLYSIQFLFIYLSNRLLYYCHAFTHFTSHHFCIYISPRRIFSHPWWCRRSAKALFLYFFKTDSSLRPHLNILIFIASVFSRNDNFWILQCIASPIHSVPRIYVKDDKYVLTFMHIWPLSSIIKPPSESRIVFVASLMWILRPKIQQKKKNDNRWKTEERKASRFWKKDFKAIKYGRLHISLKEKGPMTYTFLGKGLYWARYKTQFNILLTSYLHLIQYPTPRPINRSVLPGSDWNTSVCVYTLT